MAAWTSDELIKVEASDELDLATQRGDGMLRNPVTMWVVRVGDDLYVRSVRGPGGTWFRHARERHQGRILAGGVDRDVALEDERDPGLNDRIDAAYSAKYQRYAANIVDSVLSPEARSATLKLVPRSFGA